MTNNNNIQTLYEDVETLVNQHTYLKSEIDAKLGDIVSILVGTGE